MNNTLRLLVVFSRKHNLWWSSQANDYTLGFEKQKSDTKDQAYLAH